MKKIISALVLSVLLGSMLLPALAFAQEDIPEGCTLKYAIDVAECQGKTGECNAPDCPAICCLLNTIQTITNWIFYLLSIVVTLMIIYGGFIYITAAGTPEKAAKGKAVLTYALIGMAIALLAKILPSVVKYIMGV